jgi:hypothetical protein
VGLEEVRPIPSPLRLGPETMSDPRGDSAAEAQLRKGWAALERPGSAPSEGVPGAHEEEALARTEREDGILTAMSRLGRARLVGPVMLALGVGLLLFARRL